ncbi:MAG: Hsp20/alpha crystallin family protein [Verrucomicrobia bacterium]|nr:MAG: Hsp20/alpha crystallin family protein [Verrucomicrobiota bacterium]
MTWLDELDWLVDPWQQLERLRQETNRLFRGLLDRGPEFPAVNVSGSDDEVVVTADLPGVDPGKIDVEVSDQTLTIRGERREPELPKDSRYLFRERGHGRFERTILLPYEVDAERVESHYRDGVLSIRLPRHEKSKPRKIPVKAE